ncbi:Conserved_hypothetical protein [Hexamita inflata]|uniref:Uncharacterized protein n=1 Tax=Hexamita inflata TaxID=28002 RepID=A0AA86THP7_9EUKA|nr:Conserved hypothetical protein [Hexamita inflata]
MSEQYFNSQLSVVQLQSQLASSKVKTDDLIDKYDQEQRTRYWPSAQNKILTISGDNSLRDFKFVDQLDIVNVIITNCVNVNLSRTPINIQSLTITNTNLTNVVGLEHMRQLQYIDIRDNCIVSIEPIKHCVNLRYILLDNNFIYDLEHITSLPNYSPSWIYYQRAPSDVDLTAYLSDIRSNIALEPFKQLIYPKQQNTFELISAHPAHYDSEMINKYSPLVKSKYSFGPSYGNCLEIKNDNSVRDLRFVESLNVTDLVLKNCANAHLLRAPSNLKSLIHYGSALKTVRGVERLTELEVLSLSDNQIVNVDLIKGLNKLTCLFVDGNKINDLSPVEILRGKGCCQTICKVQNQRQASQQEIDRAMLW